MQGLDFWIEGERTEGESVLGSMGSGRSCQSNLGTTFSRKQTVDGGAVAEVRININEQRRPMSALHSKQVEPIHSFQCGLRHANGTNARTTSKTEAKLGYKNTDTTQQNIVN